MAGLIGQLAAAAYNPVFELKPQKTAHTLGNSTQVVPPHTDESYLHTPTGILVLYCIQPASDGGESVMVDGFKIAEPNCAHRTRKLSTCCAASRRPITASCPTKA